MTESYWITALTWVSSGSKAQSEMHLLTKTELGRVSDKHNILVLRDKILFNKLFEPFHRFSDKRAWPCDSWEPFRHFKMFWKLPCKVKSHNWVRQVLSHVSRNASVQKQNLLLYSLWQNEWWNLHCRNYDDQIECFLEQQVHL